MEYTVFDDRFNLAITYNNKGQVVRRETRLMQQERIEKQRRNASLFRHECKLILKGEQPVPATKDDTTWGAAR